MKKHLLFLFVALFSFVLEATDLSERVEEAALAYQKGISAEKAIDKDQHFNQALNLYLMIQAHVGEENNLSDLYYNIGNTFYQLNQMPWAILYYYKALALQPHNEAIINNLNSAQERLQISQPSTESALFYPVTVMLFLAFTFAATLCLSLYIWTKERVWYKLGLTPCVLSILFLTLGIYQSFFDPINAVIVQPEIPLRSAEEQALPASETPTLPGMKVRVLSASADGKWLKIATDNGTIGYVTYASLRLI